MPDTPGPDSWIDHYLNGELAEAERGPFEQWLLEDPARIEQLARAVLQDTQMRTAVISRRLESGFSMLDLADADNDEQLQTVDRDIMDELVAQALAERRKHEIEDAANALLEADRAKAEKEHRLARRRRVETGSAQQQTVVIPKPLVWLGAAAAIGLAVFIGIRMNPPSEPSSPPQDTARRDTGGGGTATASAPVLARVVRTLDARWDSDAGAWDGAGGLRQGGHVLTEGLVEIELAEGTRVVLEAPVEFELTGRNTMGLTRGRVVADVPRSGTGFTIDTPTARVIDYGTEFGVIAEAAQTQVHVFRGEVRAAARADGVVVSEPVPLVGDEAAVIDAAGSSISRVAFDSEAFERRVVKRLDLVDIVAGGDGTGQARMRAIHPVTGRPTSTPIYDRVRAHLLSTGRYQPVAANPFIDGVFVPHSNDAIQVDSAGNTVSGLAVSDPRSYQLIWAGGVLPGAEESEVREQIGSLYPGLRPEQAPVLYMISNKGITIDLDAVRREVGGQVALRFEMGVSNLSRLHGEITPTSPDSDIHCFLDGGRVGRVLDMVPEDGIVELDFEIPAQARFLTLVVVDSGDGLGRDWVAFHRPVFEAEVAPQRGGAR